MNFGNNEVRKRDEKIFIFLTPDLKDKGLATSQVVTGLALHSSSSVLREGRWLKRLRRLSHPRSP